ncbi:ankyrin repeat-containing domain protein, partial [Morchella snyderi]
MVELSKEKVINFAKSTHDKTQTQLQTELEKIQEQLGSAEATASGCHAYLRQSSEKFGAGEVAMIRDWISSFQFGKIHRKHADQRSPDTCHWLGKNDLFDAWMSRKSSSNVLWLRGAPGTGKTILASYVIDKLKENLQDGNCLAFFYCSTASKACSEPAPILRAILRQICIAYSPNGLPDALLRVKNQKDVDSSGPLTVYETQNLITELSHHLSGLWIVIDALDECDKTSRSRLFNALKTIEEEGSGIRIFVTGRSEGDIVGSMDVDRFENYCIEARDNTPDVEQYIKTEIRRLCDNSIKEQTTHEQLREKLRAREESLVTALKNEAKGMFLSTKLRIQALKQETTIEGIEEAIRLFPIELNEIYDDIFIRIGRQGLKDRECASKIIQWLAYTIDDPTTETLLEVLQMIYPGHSIFSDERQNLAVNHILHVCHGLLLHDQDLRQIRFFHTTVREYLSQGSINYLQGGQDWIAKLCLSVLTGYTSDFENFHDHSSLDLPGTYPPRTSFASYAMRNWGHHVRDSCSPSYYASFEFFNPSSESYRSWALHIGGIIPTLKDREGGYTTILWAACYYRLLDVFKKYLHTVKPSCTNIDGCTVLHHSADMGYLEFVEVLLSSRYDYVDPVDVDVNSTDHAGLTPLMMASRSNHATIVKALLSVSGEEVNVNTADGTGRTALMHASIAGNGDTTHKLLSSKRCDINRKDKDHLSALHHAAYEGHFSILGYFLQNPALEINNKTKLGDTALALAVNQGHSSVVRRLLKSSGIDPNCTNERMETPLLTAARLEHREILEILIADERVDINYSRSRGSDNLLIQACEKNKAWLVELLLKGKNININYRGVGGWTALAKVAARNSLDALTVLLSDAGAGLDIDPKDSSGFTPLHRATAKCNIECVQLLLSRGASVNAASEDGETALGIAAEAGYTELVRTILLHTSNFSGGITRADFINQKDWKRRTALILAATNGHHETVSILLKQEGIDVNIMGQKCHTALIIAVKKGYSDIVELLLKHEGIDVTITNRWGYTALIIAAKKGYLDVVGLLLKHGGFNVNTKGLFGYTALMRAAEKDQSDTVELLLKQEGIDVNITNKNGNTALIYAADKGHSDTVKLLLKQEGIDLNITDKGGFTALARAAREGRSSIVELFLKQEGIDFNTTNNYDYTALMIAALMGHSETIKLLLKQEGINVNIADKDGFTALAIAASGGHSDIVKLLLTQEGIDVNITSKDGYTALMYAAVKDYSETVKGLLKQEGIAVNITDDFGHTALTIAASEGCLNTVELLLKKEGID